MELFGYQDKKLVFDNLVFVNRISDLHAPAHLITFLQPNEKTLANEKAICSPIPALGDVFLSGSAYRTDPAHGPESRLCGQCCFPFSARSDQPF